MIVITGAAGFIGSCLAGKLNELNEDELVLVDDFFNLAKQNNYIHIKYSHLIERDIFFEWAQQNAGKIKFIFHLGARTDTAEFDTSVFEKLNINYSKNIWNLCTQNNIPLVYASSAATYGAGEYGYTDAHTLIPELKPLNAYGISKNEFDKFVLRQKNCPPFWVGLKFFNVYGPNEYHKGRMASVILHAYEQFRNAGKVKLFRSHKKDFEDGKQLRDFIYVKDVLNLITWLMRNKIENGIYNLGTGKARTFLELAHATSSAMNMHPVIEWIDIPADIRNTYQYFTEADMAKMYKAGYQKQFTSLEDGIHEYVRHYLPAKTYY